MYECRICCLLVLFVCRLVYLQEMLDPLKVQHLFRQMDVEVSLCRLVHGIFKRNSHIDRYSSWFYYYWVMGWPTYALTREWNNMRNMFYIPQWLRRAMWCEGTVQLYLTLDGSGITVLCWVYIMMHIWLAAGPMSTLPGKNFKVADCLQSFKPFLMLVYAILYHC